MTGPLDLAPTGLPVEDVIDELRAAVAETASAVLVAPPGAGKTTVVPLRLLGTAGLGDGRIVVLEPRRLAARAAARRMAVLLGESVGHTVGYRTRDEKAVGPGMRIEVITEGILVRRLQADPTLAGTDMVVLDEVHERNLVTDLSLALLLDARKALRPDLAVLAMSATIAAERIAALIGGDGDAAPIVRSDGRQHPVEVLWWPPGPRDDPEQHLARSIARVLAEHPDGDALVFLPGAREIRRLSAKLAGIGGTGVDVRPLFGALPPKEQDAALAPSPPGRRRVVLATDIAESSLTVDGVRIVVDAGLARGPRYDAASGLTRLVTTPASRAAADQRAGRAGRLASGTAVRVWTEGEHHRRPAFPEPEIAVVDLAGLVMEVAEWGSGLDALPLLDAPPRRAWEDALSLLGEIGLLDADGRPTATGRRVGGLPVHPRLARMVVEGHDRGHGWTACLLAAQLEERDVFGGRRDLLSADLAQRVAVVAGEGSADRVEVSRQAVRVVARRARELARRVGVRPGPVDDGSIGPLVALAYPDRVAQARGGGRFRLRDGGGGQVEVHDPLAGAAFLAVADIEGGSGGVKGSGDGRIRLAAALDATDVIEAIGDRLETVSALHWDPQRNDLRARTEDRVGAIVLSSSEGRADPGPATVAALLDQVRETGGRLLPWNPSARALQARLTFMHRLDPTRWPDCSDTALLDDLERWLGPALSGASGRRDLDRVDLVRSLRQNLDHRDVVDIDRLAPARITLSSGRELRVDYHDGVPTISTRVQDLYGTTTHPTVADGQVSLVLELLSPAGRPVQITSDLPNFWAGTWVDVRKEMAGRYPKHDWPQDPARASPRPARHGSRERGRR